MATAAIAIWNKWMRFGIGKEWKEPVGIEVYAHPACIAGQ